MNSLQGHFLVASPELQDPNFRQTVVLIVRHSDDGALGLILNRPTTTTIKEAWEQVSDSTCESDEPLRFGGPCQGLLMAIHADDELSEIEVVDDVCFSAGPDKLEQLVSGIYSPVRFYVGYSGWGAGQLEHELEAGGWLTLPASAQYVFGDDDNLWERISRDIAAQRVIAVLKIKHIPPDPSLN